MIQAINVLLQRNTLPRRRRHIKKKKPRKEKKENSFKDRNHALIGA
jgi:hypothetical protein